MRAAQGVVVGLWLYASFLVFTAPATLLDRSLDEFSAGRIRLVAAQGTLWTGSGQIELRDAVDAAVHSVDVRWQPDSSAWLSAQVGWRVEFAGQSQPLWLAAGLRRIELQDLNLDLPAAAAAAAMPAAAGYGLGGQLHVQAERFAFGTDAGGSASVQWQGASTLLAPVAPLGSYDLAVTATGSDFALRLRTLAGPLQLDGQGTVIAGAGLQYHIAATLPAAEREQLEPFLQLVAVEAADGSYLLERR